MYVDITDKVTKCHFLWDGDQCTVLLKTMKGEAPEQLGTVDSRAQSHDADAHHEGGGRVPDDYSQCSDALLSHLVSTDRTEAGQRLSKKKACLLRLLGRAS